MLLIKLVNIIPGLILFWLESQPIAYFFIFFLEACSAALKTLSPEPPAA